MAATSSLPTPDLQSPTSLLVHPSPSPSDAVHHALPANNFTSTKRSHVSVGSAYKLSSDARTLRRLKGCLPILVCGHAINLVNPLSQTPIQSFTLSSSDVPISAPLTLLKSLGGGRSLRVTYLAVKSTSQAQSPVRSEIWAFVEELTAKGKENAQVNSKKEILSVEGAVSLIQPLADGRLVLTHPDDSLTILSHSSVTFDDDASLQEAATGLQVSRRIASPKGQTRRSYFHVALLDQPSSRKIVSSSAKVEAAAVVGLRISISSACTLDAHDAKRKKKKKSRKSAIEEIDEADGNADENGFVPQGALELEVLVISSAVDGSDQSVIRFDVVQIPGFDDARKIHDVSLHPDGRLLVLTSKGQITSSLLSISDRGPTLTATKDYVLPSLSTAGSRVGSSSPSCLMPLSHDHTLVVGVTNSHSTPSKQKTVALLLDMALDAVLCQIEWPVPFSSGSNLQQTTSISISRIAGSMAVMLMSPTTPSLSSSEGDVTSTQSNAQQRRISVLTMPFVVPEMSVLRHALGKGELTSRWMGAENTETSDSRPAATMEKSLVTLLASLEKLSRGRTPATVDKVNLNIDKTIEDVVASESPDASETVLKRVTSSGNESFFQSIMDPFLPEAGSVKMSVPRSVSRLLMEYIDNCGSGLGSAGVATSATKRAAFLARLKAQSDVGLLEFAVECMRTLSEEELVGLLTATLRLSHGADGTKAKVKSTDLVSFLRRMVSTPVSRPGLRTAMKNQIRQVEDVVVLLQICNIWLDRATATPLDDTLPLDESSDASQLPGSSVEDQRKKTAHSISQPDPQAVVKFASDVMDTFFPLLISTTSSYQVLGSLSKTINRYVTAMNSLRTLSAPLSAFSKLDQELKLEKQQRQDQGNAPLTSSGAMVSAGNKKVRASSMTSTALRAETGGGLGIKLGTQGEAKSVRLMGHEQSMLIGAYTFERLEI